MKAVLLAAGEGTRLRPLTGVLPKCLFPIQGVPLLQHWLETLKQMGVTEVLVNTHYQASIVESFLEGQDFDIAVAYEPELLGTAGTLRANAAFLKNSDVLIAHADNLSLFNPMEFASAFAQRPAPAVATMMTFATDAPRSCGIIELDDAGLVTEFHEKVDNPPGNLANGAVYVFSSSAVNQIINGRASDISTQVLPALLGQINTFHNGRYHRDIGTVESYLTAATDMIKDRRMLGFSPKWGELATRELWSRWVDAAKTGRLGVMDFLSVDDLVKFRSKGRKASAYLVYSARASELEALRTVALNDPTLRLSLFKLEN